MIKFSPKDKQIGKRIFKKFKKGRKKNPKWPLLTLRELFRILNKEEKELIKKILKINPREYRKKDRFFGIKKTPKNLVAIKNQYYRIGKVCKKIEPQFLSEKVFLAYQRLNQSMQKEIGRYVNVASGYRSSGYQMAMFFCVLYQNNWNIGKTLRRIALPGYSEHSYPARQAVDFAPQRGIKRIEDFYKTKEFKWLKKNAKKFGFYLSYPKNNKSGTAFEPWHWHFK